MAPNLRTGPVHVEGFQSLLLDRSLASCFTVLLALPNLYHEYWPLLLDFFYGYEHALHTFDRNECSISFESGNESQNGGYEHFPSLHRWVSQPFCLNVSKRNIEIGKKEVASILAPLRSMQNAVKVFCSLF
jgi:hypothetical protein